MIDQELKDLIAGLAADTKELKASQKETDRQMKETDRKLESVGI